ncbi:hypothetical protein SSX86_025253 [Deinandra increscens subsp. villosa]|uniref:Hydroxyproline-rich glycoprotein family protein n=1 Tax=Deinandra increscens subsp. villosa TaxID=3103831 RepID=A0AAP0CCQ8_9ASTR
MESSSHPILGFPLGTALLLIVIFSLSGILSCCYHWDKLRHLRPSSDHHDHSPSKPKNNPSEAFEKLNESFPVVMPGDRIARFIALPSPCEPPRPQNQKVELAQQNHKIPKSPPHVAITLS